MGLVDCSDQFKKNYRGGEANLKDKRTPGKERMDLVDCSDQFMLNYLNYLKTLNYQKTSNYSKTLF